MATIPQTVARRSIPGSNVIDYPGSDPVASAVREVGGDITQIGVRFQQQQEELDGFKARVAFNQFNSTLEQDLAESARTISADGAGFHDNFLASPDGKTGFEARSKEFIAALPESQRAKYEALIPVERTQYSTKAAGVEWEARQGYFRRETDSTLDRLGASLASVDPNDKAAFTNFRKQGEDMIAATGLPEAEKAERLLKWRQSSAELSWRALATRDPQSARHALGLEDTSDAAAVIRGFEGFRDKPYWDVNALRVGYGSDTVTRADGTVEKVGQGTVVSEADAERDLQRRVAQFQAGIVSDVGDEQWGQLPDNVRAGLSSVAYNYGSLPEGVVAAVKSGDMEAIAQSVEALSGHNNGINSSRRAREAAIIRGADERFQDIPAEKRYALAEDARVLENRQAADQERERTAALNTQVNALENRILDGSAGYAEVDEAGRTWLTDASKRKGLYEMVNSVNTGALAARGAQEAFAETDKVWDPTDTGDKNRVDALFAGGAQQLSARNAGYVGETMLPIIERTGMIPKDARGALLAMVRSQDGQSVMFALETMDRVERLNPEAFRRDMGEDAQKKLMTWRWESPYRKPEEVVETLRKSEDPATAEARKQLEKDALDKKKVTQVTDAEILDHFDPGVSAAGPDAPSVPLIAGALRQDFDRLFSQEYARTGDRDQAKENALGLLSNQWGASKANGESRLMRFPPEKIYPSINGNHDWLADQAERDLRPIVGEGADFMLIADARTESEVRRGTRPSYAVVTRDSNGVFSAAMKDGARVRQTFDVKPYEDEFIARADLERAYETAGRPEREQLRSEIRARAEAGQPMTLQEATVRRADIRVRSQTIRAQAQRAIADFKSGQKPDLNIAAGNITSAMGRGGI